MIRLTHRAFAILKLKVKEKKTTKKKKNVTKNDFQNVFYTILMSLMTESYRVCYMDDSETQFIQLIKHSHLHFRS